MALRDRLLKLIPTTSSVEKAPSLPAGANSFTADQVAQLMSAQGIGTFNPLPRDPRTVGIPFGPSLPLTPAAINTPNADGRTEPRRWEYPVAWNIFVTEQRLVPWKVLRASAEQIDILRRCIEVLKSKAISMEWDVTLSEDATERIAAESGMGYLRAMQEARSSMAPEIARIKEFWKMPDRTNGLTFIDWLSMALEELLVLDALAIYPRATVGGRLHSFEILDGSTIKPLLDDRGMRPAPPFPAYQQILYGFPRGEFQANPDSTADGEFSSDELIYTARNRRTWTPYGFSPVERSLPLADIYLRRQQWLRSEFTDGVSPDLFFKTDPQYGGTPELLRAWETIFNDDMAGQTERRRGGKLLPSGFEPVDMSGRSEKFQATLDEYLIKGICGHWGIMPSEIGFTPNTGLGGAGFQEGEAETAGVVGVGPLMNWFGDFITDLSYKYLGMPRELVVQFSGGRTSESVADAQRRSTETGAGHRTLNEARAEMGLALLDSPLADMPMVEGFPAFLSPTGLIASTTTTGVNQEGQAEVLPSGMEVAPSSETPNSEPMPIDEEQKKALFNAEMDKFMEFATKSWARKRDFTFYHVDSISADALNAAAKTGDMDEVRAVASVVRPF